MKTEEEIVKHLRLTYGASLLTKREIATELGVSRATIDRMRLEGEIESIIIRKQVRFKFSELIRLIT